MTEPYQAASLIAGALISFLMLETLTILLALTATRPRILSEIVSEMLCLMRGQRVASAIVKETGFIPRVPLSSSC